ncbi:hypothetical protein ILUMI_01018 [Ignelater luminosus]|uniref:Protein hunchback n=1 Tax=Ignelater luminosus TaxID=2038154 RepID=A0A8K0GPM5_IGNLU|nr:hypothetical protein ILUMI_01018 [Ignelater luminosus]
MRGGVIVDRNMSSTCLQGSLARPLGGYQPNVIMEPHSAAPAWQLHHPIFPKQEPMDEDRNDSGITSGSEFHSSSPGSETSQDYSRTATYSTSQTDQNPQTSTYYSTRLMSRLPSSPLGYNSNIPKNLDYQSIIPPNTNNLQVPSTSNQSRVKSEGNTEIMQTDNLENEDPLRSLEFALENTGLLPQPAPSTSPKTISEHSDDKSDDDIENEQSIRVPRMNSHGKVKTHKCKQCNFVAYTKFDFWEHSKGHIKADKLLTCLRCPFVTEYKHHLEYHMRNHTGSKPYKCSKCSYSCVNKSMLNSHLKSHSNVYQYRCANCNYASKYCHSLKLHLRKYHHKPAMVLNPDGTPNPYPIVDVYGTRRGPKQKQASKAEGRRSPTESPLQNPFAQYANLLNNAVPQMPLPLSYHFFTGLQNPMPNPLLFPVNLENLPNPASSPEHKSEQERPSSNCSSPPATSVDQETPQVLDLSKPDSSPEKKKPPKNRRKGRAFKLENLPVNDSSDDEDDLVSNAFNNRVTLPEKASEDKHEEVINNNDNKLSCQHCNISFGDIVLYTMHMGYHGYTDPFTCNMCGEQCKDKVSFFLHIARNPHT